MLIKIIKNSMQETLRFNGTFSSIIITTVHYFQPNFLAA